MDRIYEYSVMGRRASTANESLEKVNDDLKNFDKKIYELPVEINVGIAMYAISRSKQSDLYSGGDTQIGIINNDGFSKIPITEQIKHYDKTIKYLSELFEEDGSQIRKSLPTNITTLL